MPYEKIDKVGEILQLFPECVSEKYKDRLRPEIQAILDRRPRWIKDCDCEEREIICDCQQLSER